MLGFNPAPKRLAIERKEDCLWHFWDKETQKIEPVTINRLTGFVRGIKSFSYPDKETGEVREKIVIDFEADEQYLIYCGLKTWAAKNIIMALCAAPKHLLVKAITLELSAPANTRRKIVFCRVFDFENNLIQSDYKWQKDEAGKIIDNFDWAAIVTSLNKKINELNQN